MLFYNWFFATEYFAGIPIQPKVSFLMKIGIGGSNQAIIWVINLHDLQTLFRSKSIHYETATEDKSSDRCQKDQIRKKYCQIENHMSKKNHTVLRVFRTWLLNMTSFQPFPLNITLILKKCVVIFSFCLYIFLFFFIFEGLHNFIFA